MHFLQYIIFNTIYGMFLFAVIMYWISYFAKRLFRAFLAPEIIAVVSFLIALFTFPTISKYFYEQETRTIINHPWVKIIQTRSETDILEPLSYLKAPTTFFYIAYPKPITQNEYYISIFNYDKQLYEGLIETDCEDKKYTLSIPINDVYKITPGFVNMNDYEYVAFCKYDWKNETDFLRLETLKNK